MQVESISPRLMPVNRDGKAKTACHTTEQMHDSRAGVFPSARAGWAASAAAWKQSDARGRVPRGIVFEVDLLRLNNVSNLHLTQPKPATASVACAPLGAQTLPVLLSTEARTRSITVHDSASPDWINHSVVDYLLAQGAGEEIHCEPRDRGVATQAQTLRADAASARHDRQHGSLSIERSAQQCGHTALRPRDFALWSSARSQAATTRAGDKDHVPNGRGARIEGVSEGRRDWQVRGKAVDWQIRGKAVDMTKWHSGEHIEGWPQAPVTEIMDHALSLYMANDVLLKTPQPTDAGAVKTTLVPIGSACNTPRLTPEVIMTCAPDSARICADIGLSILGAWQLSILARLSTPANPLCSRRQLSCYASRVLTRARLCNLSVLVRVLTARLCNLGPESRVVAS
jgi:hypothetical protein